MQKSTDDIPQKIHSDIQMNGPNERIEIFSGEIELVSNGKSLLLKEAQIFFLWYPKLGPKFKGKCHPSELEDSSFFNSLDSFTLRVKGIDFGKAYISELVRDDMIYIEGEMASTALLGDSSIKVDEVQFILPNFRNFLGDPVETTIENGRLLRLRGRITLEDDKYSVILDKVIKEKEKRVQLRSEGGIYQMYDGQIKKKKGSISQAETKELVTKLAFFLSFINGRRCSPILLTGKYKGEVIWKDYTPYHMDSFKECGSWSSKFNIDGFSDLWNTFSTFWKNENDRDVLTTAIHWYLEANNNAGYLEGSIVMAQTALELIYNWHIVEGKKMIIGKDSETIAASNKIRILISQVKDIDTDIPESFNALKDFIDQSKTVNDAIEAIVFIRNSIIHSQSQKRSELRKISIKAKYEALQLSIWYIEVALLSLLNFRGKRQDRTKKKFWESSEDDVDMA